MKLIEIFQESLMTLTLNKLRTGLAVLGIVIGIGSVIALMSLGQATQKSIQNQIQSLGSNLLTVSPGAQSSGGVRGASGGSKTLTNEDGKALAAGNLQNVNKVSMEYSGRAQVVTAGNNTNTQIYGVTPEIGRASCRERV
jgi:putative ABC transport system permease protein